MVDLKSLKDVMKESTALWGRGRHADALKLVDEWILRAEQQAQALPVKILSMHGSLIANSMGNLELARAYCERVLSFEPENALALYTVADLLFRRREDEKAKEYAAKSYALVKHSEREEDRALREILLEKWPKVVEWQS